MSNRNKIKQWFITFPQWAPDYKGEILNLLAKHLELSYYKIAQEKHKDGNDHYHAVIKLECGMTKSALLKLFQDEYPRNFQRIDVKAVRSMKASVKYLSKEDTDPLEHPDGYTECRQPMKYIYKKTMLDWVNFLGYDSIEEYEKNIEKDTKIRNDKNEENFKNIVKNFFKNRIRR